VKLGFRFSRRHRQHIIIWKSGLTVSPPCFINGNAD
jgi:hypothetical protein